MYCNCPKIPTEVLRAREKLLINDKAWNLLCLQDMYNAGNSIDDIFEVIPFRGIECTRTLHCCGVCTRQCHTRCIQDCLNRLYMWRKLVESTSEDKRESIPLNIRMIVKQDFETLYDLSWCVGDILSRNTNTTIRNYMDDNNLYRHENPYKLDYSPREDIDPTTGKRRIEPGTGRIKFLEWPRSGLCPFCSAKTTVDRRFYKYEYRGDESYT